MRIILIISLLTLAFNEASACICVKNEPLDTTYKEASVVFIGRVTELIKNKLFVDTNDKEGYVIANFEITEGLKRSDGKNKKISIITDNSSCSYYFEEGKEYVVFGYSDAGGILRTNQCTRTGLLVQYNKTDLAKLKELSSDKDAGNGYLGIVTLYRPEYNSVINKISQLEEAQKTWRLTSLSLVILLIISVGCIFYLLRKNIFAD